MPRSAALPFILKRSKDEFGAASMTSTRETVHGLLRLEGDRLVIQWRLARQTEHLGVSYRTDEEVEPVREEVIPLSAVSGSYVRNRWWEFWRGPRLVLTAADLRAFDGVVGEEGLRLSHPAEMVVGLKRAHRMLAEEFTAEVTLAVAELASGDRTAFLHGPEGGREAMEKP
jgi:hypothetical protein